MSQIKEVSIQPGIGMLALFPAMNYKPWYAISEFVDNAIQSWSANKELLKKPGVAHPSLRIEVTFDKARGEIRVKDNAAGISALDIPRAFTPAAPPADASGLSQFGIGMKSAACWYSDHFTVTTTALGEPVTRIVDFNVSRIVDDGYSTLPVAEVPAAPDAHGTEVVLRSLRHGIPAGRTVSKIYDYLASIYRSYLKDPSLYLYVGNRRIQAPTFDCLVAPRWDDETGPKVEWRKDLVFELSSGKVITGWAGILSRGSTSKAGLSLLYRKKVVQGAGNMADDPDGIYRPGQIFGRGNTFRSQRLIGEIDVSDIGVTHTKDALAWDDAEEESFLNELQIAMDSENLPLLRMANNYRATERTRSAQRLVETAVDSAVKSAQTISFPVRTDTHQDPRVDVEELLASEREVADAINQLDSAHKSSGLFEIRSLEGAELFGFQVIDFPDGARKWINIERQEDRYVISLNRAHRFMQTFANLPGAEIEPYIRLAIAIGAAQAKFELSGETNPAYFITALNQVLDSGLSEKIE